MFKTDGGAGAVVLGHGSLDRRFAEVLPVLCHRCRVEGVWATRPMLQQVVEIEIRRGTDQPLGQAARLGREEPVEGIKRAPPIHRLPNVQRRHSIQADQAPHSFRMVEGQAVGGSDATVVAGEEEAFVAKSLHKRNHDRCHGPLAVVTVLRIRRRTEALAVARQVGNDEREVLGWRRCHPMPGGMGLG